jgi:transcription initiation factor TFIID subunit 1
VKEGERWRVGHVEALPPGDLTPFSLGALAPGQRQLAAECNMFIAPAFPYTPRSTDFLVVRLPTGALTLREITGTFVLGQQEPHMAVPAPGSKEAK